MRKICIFLVIALFPILAKAQEFVDLVEKVNKGVVTIYVQEQRNLGKGNPKGQTSLEGLGSGSLIGEERLYILTAAHVVENATEIVVRFFDGQMIKAKTVRSSSIADVALLKLDQPAKGLTPLKIGNSDSVRLGEDVFVIGAPLGLSHSVSKGIISGKHTDENVSGNFMKMEFLQTDASINKGNSGGPMFNMKGEIIGVVSSILSFSGGFEGLGFAASSNIANSLLTQRGSVWLGVDALPLDEKLCKVFNVPQKGAFLVQNVTEGSPSYFMGMKGGYIAMKIGETEFLAGGDIILSFDGIVLDEPAKVDEIINHLNTVKKYHQYEVKVLREGKIETLKWKMDL